MPIQAGLDQLEERENQCTYPDFDLRSAGSTQPVSVRAEAHAVDGSTSIQCVQVLAFVQVPQHSLAILETGEMNSR